MAGTDEQRAPNGTALGGAAVYDQELYGGAEDDRFAGYERSIGLAEEDDDRKQANDRSETYMYKASWKIWVYASSPCRAPCTKSPRTLSSESRRRICMPVLISK